MTHLPQHYKLPAATIGDLSSPVFFRGWRHSGRKSRGGFGQDRSLPRQLIRRSPRILAATIYSALGLPDTAAWYDDQNRPTHIFEGTPIAGLF